MGHTHTNTIEYYSATEKNEIMPPAATWMDTEMATLSQSDKDKYHMLPL